MVVRCTGNAPKSIPCVSCFVIVWLRLRRGKICLKTPSGYTPVCCCRAFREGMALQRFFRNGAVATHRPTARKRLRRMYSSEKELMEALEPPPSVCRHLLLGESEDGDMTVVERRVSLKDPVSLQLMECPVRGPNCDHLEAFDRRSYLDFNEMMERDKWCKLTRRWLCPWCQVPARGKDLVEAPEFKQVLDEMRQACSDATYAIVQQDGSLRMPFVAADRRIQTSSFKRKSSSSVDKLDTSSDADSPKSPSVTTCEVQDLRSPQRLGKRSDERQSAEDVEPSQPSPTPSKSEPVRPKPPAWPSCKEAGEMPRCEAVKDTSSGKVEEVGSVEEDREGPDEGTRSKATLPSPGQLNSNKAMPASASAKVSSKKSRKAALAAAKEASLMRLSGASKQQPSILTYCQQLARCTA
eukprot:s2144_g3.t1